MHTAPPGASSVHPPGSPGGPDPGASQGPASRRRPASIPKRKRDALAPRASPPPPQDPLKPRRLGWRAGSPSTGPSWCRSSRAEGPRPTAPPPHGGLADSLRELWARTTTARGAQGVPTVDSAGRFSWLPAPGERLRRELAWSDSLDESRSSGLGRDAAGRLRPSRPAAACPSSKGTRPTVPLLTVRLHTERLGKALRTEDQCEGTYRGGVRFTASLVAGTCPGH